MLGSVRMHVESRSEHACWCHCLECEPEVSEVSRDCIFWPYLQDLLWFMGRVTGKGIVKHFPVTWSACGACVGPCLSIHLLFFQHVIPNMSARKTRTHFCPLPIYLFMFLFVCMCHVCPHAFTAHLCNGQGHQLRTRPHLCGETEG